MSVVTRTTCPTTARPTNAEADEPCLVARLARSRSTRSQLSLDLEPHHMTIGRRMRLVNLHGLGTLVALSAMAGIVACRQRPRTEVAVVPSASRAAPLAVEHCWWSTNRSLLGPDSTAARFRSAYATVGFSAVRQGAAGDTAWVQASPVAFPDAPPGIRYGMHAVAYQVGDSTHYRYFVAAFGAGPVPRTANDSIALIRDVIPRCVAVARAAAIPGIQPAEPTGEERLSVWRWRP
jgi:hypothetical protein